jgi:hypothetical protein
VVGWFIFSLVVGVVRLGIQAAGISGWAAWVLWLLSFVPGYLAARAFLRWIWTRNWEQAA